jgi:nitrilase
MTLPRLAALQMVSTHDIATNLAAAERLIEQAARAGARLLVLPETFALFSADAQYALGQQEASVNARVRPFIAEQARRWGVWIVAGTLPLAVPGSERVSSSCLVVNDQGVECARYDKMHLFDVDVDDPQGRYRESDTFVAGDKVVVVDSPVGRLGLAVCYDIRFPELFRAMFAEGVDVIAVPAAFTLLTGEAHWLALLRARAIENQCYIVGANQGGRHSKTRTTSGGSVIIDGWGKVLSEAGRGECCVMAEMDIQQLQQQRRAMPISRQQRFVVNKKPVTAA